MFIDAFGLFVRPHMTFRLRVTRITRSFPATNQWFIEIHPISMTSFGVLILKSFPKLFYVQIILLLLARDGCAWTLTTRCLRRIFNFKLQFWFTIWGLRRFFGYTWSFYDIFSRFMYRRRVKIKTVKLWEFIWKLLLMFYVIRGLYTWQIWYWFGPIMQSFPVFWIRDCHQRISVSFSLSSLFCQ